MPSIGGVWWRHLPHGGGPLDHANPPSDGRWQRGDVVPALYFADEEGTAWAEWYRGLAERGMPPEMGLPRDLWSYEIQLDDVTDLSAGEALKEHGLERARPTQRQWPAFQRVGEALWRAGARAILYESAAHPGKLALCVFVADEGAAGLRPIPPPRVVSDPPPAPQGLRTSRVSLWLPGSAGGRGIHELAGGYVEGLGEGEDRGEAGLAVAGLDVGDLEGVHRGAGGELLLGDPGARSQLPDPRAEGLGELGHRGGF